jgi:hypothetical protein
MRVEEKIYLNKFQMRDYQIPIADALENKGYRKIIASLPRRAGKDLLCWNLIIRQALKRIGVYYYMFPTYAQAKKVIWQSSTNDSLRFIDFIPPSLIESSNSQDMSIRLVNGSLIQLIGSDNIDAIVGTNPIGVVYSEAALQDPRAYQFIRPILAANDGFAIFISTPRGKNWFYELFQIAKNSPDWFAYHLTLDDTQHIPLHEIERERAEGIMSEDLIQQEYYCSWDMGVEGSYYSRYVDRMRVQGRISDVPWESSFKVHTAWDLGMRDSTTIIFFQTIGATVRIIDCYENSGFGLDHYIKILQQKPYAYGKHIAPHDIKVRELGTGQSRLEKARTMGITFIVAPDLSIEDGIEAVRAALSKIWIDSSGCSALIKAIENYRHEYDGKKKSYKNTPLHDWSSHFSDCLRYLCISLPKTKDGATAEDIERNYREAVGGNQSHLPSIFRTDLPKY